MKFGRNNADAMNGNNGAEEDRLSSLPDAILVEILSLLPMKSAAATSALSRRWRHRWTELTCLRFSDDIMPKHTSGIDIMCRYFFHTVNHIFLQLTSPKIHSFSLCFAEPLTTGDHFRFLVESWVREVCSRNAEEIELRLRWYGPSLYPTIGRVFECRSLRVLVLKGHFDLKLPENGLISLPNLKKLDIRLNDGDGELMRTLFKSCPLLEDLYLDSRMGTEEHFVDIFSPKLKHLSLDSYDYEPSRQGHFTIDAPNLESFDFNGVVTTRFFRFATIPGGLLKASVFTLNPKNRDAEQRFEYRSHTLELIRGISSVRSLELHSKEFDYINYLDVGLFPTFHNLTHLRVIFCWKSFPRFLESFPNLVDLYIYNDGLTISDVLLDSVPSCLVSKLKRIEILGLSWTNNELKFLMYILSNGNILEWLHVTLPRSQQRERSEEVMFCECLFSYPRRSLSCEIKFSGNKFSATSKDFKDEFF